MLKLIAILVGGWFVLFGWDELNLAITNSEPVKMSCEKFLADAKRPKWVSVDDCTVYLGKFEYSKSKRSEKINSAGVMVYASRKDAEADAFKTPVALKIDDQGQMQAASANIDALNKISEQVSGIVQQLKNAKISNSEKARLQEQGLAMEKDADRIREALFIAKPMVIKFSSERPSYNLIKDSLTENYDVYEMSSANDKPSYLMAALKMLGGLALILGGLYTLFRRKAA